MAQEGADCRPLSPRDGGGMRWSSREIKLGDRRVVRRFAWLPVRCGDEVVWLERYVSHEECVIVSYEHHVIGWRVEFAHVHDAECDICDDTRRKAGFTLPSPDVRPVR